MVHTGRFECVIMGERLITSHSEYMGAALMGAPIFLRRSYSGERVTV